MRQLVLLPGDGSPLFEPYAGPVRLVREYKGPTVAELLSERATVDDALPGEPQTMDQARAAAQGDGGVVGRSPVLRGPGHDRGRAVRAVLPLLLWAWLLTLVALLVGTLL